LIASIAAKKYRSYVRNGRVSDPIAVSRIETVKTAYSVSKDSKKRVSELLISNSEFSGEGGK
jgi:hypothetical protein